MDKLYTLPADHYRSLKIQFAAALAGHKLQVLSSEPDFVFGDTNKTPDFVAKFPMGKVPALETKTGDSVFESNAIAYYVADEQLRGKSVLDQAQVQQWINFADNEILPSACTWVFPTMGITQYNKGETEAAKEQLKKCLEVLNVYLTSKTFLVGERMTLADIVMCCNMRMLFTQVMDPAFRAPYPNVTRWFETLVNHPEFVKLATETKLCEKAAQPDPKKYQEIHGGQKKGGKKEEAKKETKSPQAKKEKPAKEAEESAGDAPQEKEEDPLAKAPKGSFDFDAFKRSFSNEDTATKAIPLLWSTFDAENYSIYHAVYKFKDELTMPFMTHNLIRGMLQRVDKLRKHAFGVCYVLGDKSDHNIEALWIFRGPEVAFGLSENWNVDAPSYEFKKLEITKPEDKEKAESFIMAATVGGAAFPDDDHILAYEAFK